MTTIRFSICEQDFRRLVAGKVLNLNLGIGSVEIALLDIGWDRMRNAIDDAEDAQDTDTPKNLRNGGL